MIVARALGVGMLLFFAACTSRMPRESEPQKSTDPVSEVPVVQPDPARDQAARELEVTCRKVTRLKMAKDACACVARNHRALLPVSDIQTLVQKYEQGPSGKRPANPAMAELYAYDNGVATECVKNPEYRVPEIH